MVLVKLMSWLSPEMVSSKCRRLWAASLVGISAVMLPVPALAQYIEKTEEQTSIELRVELNKLEQTGTACRSYMVLANRSDTELKQLSLDLVVFDTDGVIDRRLAVELGPVQSGRTQVKVFEMAELDCDRVARVLMNEVLACSPDRLGETATCDDALLVSGRGTVEFIR